MTLSVRRSLVGLAATLAAMLALTFGTTAPASAIGGETFGCRIAPGTVFTWDQFCSNSKPAQTYNVGFAVLNTSGGGYTYSWTITGPYQYVIVGCTSTSYDCAVAVSRGSKEITGTVTYTQNGQSATQTAYASIEPYCGNQLC
jgi:hypothetical protein